LRLRAARLGLLFPANPVCGRNGYAYIYDAQPTDPTKIGGIGNRVEACIEIEYTPGDGLRGEPK
jgi:hypothetical protein